MVVSSRHRYGCRQCPVINIYKDYRGRGMVEKRLYAFTVKDNRKGCYGSQAEYEEWRRKAALNGFKVDCMYYEIDTLDKLHIHGVATAREGFYVRRVCPNGYHVKVEVIESDRDLKKWANYIAKEWVCDELVDQMLVRHYCRHNYVFRD